MKQKIKQQINKFVEYIKKKPTKIWRGRILILVLYFLVGIGNMFFFREYSLGILWFIMGSLWLLIYELTDFSRECCDDNLWAFKELQKIYLENQNMLKDFLEAMQKISDKKDEVKHD